MKKRDRLLKFILKPPMWCCAVVWSLGALSLAATITLYYVGLGLKLWALPVHIAALLFFLLSIYAVLTIIGIPERVKDKPKVRQFFSSYNARGFVYALCSIVFNACYVVFGIIIANLTGSLWLAAVVGYHIFLIIPRVVVLYQSKVKGRREGMDEQTQQLRSYAYCGLALVLLAVALVPVIRMTLEQQNSYNYIVQTVVYVCAIALYTFVKLGIALYNMKKVRKQSDMALIAVKNISFADALISLFALQAMMIKEIGNMPEYKGSLMNLQLGIAIAIGIAALGLYMLITGNKKLKKLAAESSSEQVTPEIFDAESAENIDSADGQTTELSDERATLPEERSDGEADI